MIYYPLSILMLAGIREILIISSPEHLPGFQDMFADGSHLGLDISYTVQPRPDGLAQAFILGKEFIGRDSVCLILGDNIFYGHEFYPILEECASLQKGGIIFGYQVTDPHRYGIVSFDKNRKVLSIEEKPEHPKSRYAVTPSARGELEITSVNNAYLKRGDLKAKLLGRGFAWLDTGTHEALLDAANFIETIEKRQGLKIGCIEEVAFRKGFITAEQLEVLAHPMKKTPYGQYLFDLLIQNL
jgi:glucose-1-phosphate thymidylyltransferase